MKYCFQDFQFDASQLLLRRDGQICAVNEKAVALLALLVDKRECIVSKQEILDAVWTDRVVTDQVVFQNISTLRALFGDAAIKTFSKKGYQWQLPVTLVAETKPSDAFPVRRDNNPVNNGNRNESKTGVYAALLVFVVVCGWWLLSLEYDRPESDRVESTVSQSAGVFRVITGAQQIRFEPLANTLTVQQFFDSPHTSWQQVAEADGQPWLMATRRYQLGGKIVLRFQIQGPEHGWHDYLLADDLQQAMGSLEQLIGVLKDINYFSLSHDFQALTQLQRLENAMSLDKALNSKLELEKMRLLYRLNQHQDAERLAMQIDESTLETLSQGLLLVQRAKNRMFLDQWLQVREDLLRANQLFATLGLSHLESVGLMELAWTHFADQTLMQGIEVLNLAVTKARASSEPLLEVKGHLRLAFLASKANLPELFHSQISLAKELFALHNLAAEHHVVLHYNLAWSMEDAESALPHYQRVLDMPFAPQYQVYFYSAAKRVSDICIDQKNWPAALDSIRPWQRLSFQRLIEAKIAIAQSMLSVGVEKARQAFEIATQQHEKLDALDGALILLQYHGSADPQANEYKDFIANHATRRWRAMNSNELERLSL